MSVNVGNGNENALEYRGGIHLKMFALSKILLSKRSVSQAKTQCFNVLFFYSGMAEMMI